MTKNYNYILTILLYPFLLLMSYLMLTGFLNGEFYLYLIILMTIVFIPSFIMSLYGVVNEIINSKSKWRIIILILFSIFYLPIYYTKYVSKQEKYFGFILAILSIVISFFTFKTLNNKIYLFLVDAYKNTVVINENYTYTSRDNSFIISISKDFRCNSKDIGDYVISCDKLDDDSFIGIYSYDVRDYSEEEISDILEFHINQSSEYINEKDYDSEIVNDGDIIKVYYQNMVIFLTQRNYTLNNYKYSLIIIKEMPKELENIEEFQKMIETIYFLNYNERVSS